MSVVALSGVVSPTVVSSGVPVSSIVVSGMVESTPELDREWGPVLHPWPDLGNVVAVVNTHLHFDHCGGNRRFAGTPTYVQRTELAAAVAPDYLEEWVRFPGASYVELDGDADHLGEPGREVEVADDAARDARRATAEPVLLEDDHVLAGALAALLEREREMVGGGKAVDAATQDDVG